MIFFCFFFKISSHYFLKSTFKKCCKINIFSTFDCFYFISVTMLTIFLYICNFFKYRHTITSLTSLFSKSISIKSSKIKAFLIFTLLFVTSVTIFFIYSLLSIISSHRHAYYFLITYALQKP